MPQRKHIHQVPLNKQIGKYWAIDFGNDAGHFKSALMGWTRGGHDPFTFMSTPYNSYHMFIKFAKLSDAIDFAVQMGWGYEVSYPKFRSHEKTNYPDNFKWKGHPPAEKPYD